MIFNEPSEPIFHCRDGSHWETREAKVQIRSSYPVFPDLYDSQYVQLLLSGDENASNKLAKYYYGKFFAILITRYKKLPHSDAEDIVIETQIKIHQKIPRARFTTAEKFEGWMMKILLSTAVDYYRKKIKHKEISLSNANIIIPGIGFRIVLLNNVTTVKGSGFMGIQKEIVMWIHLKDCVKKLEPKERRILRMSISGMTPQEVANAEGISVDTFYQRKHRALAALRDLYNR